MKTFVISLLLVVFRPFVGEVIVGKVLSCREDGIKGCSSSMLCLASSMTSLVLLTVSLDFFDDITIPTYLLQAPSEYKFKQWIWKFSEDESNPIEFSIQAGDKIRFRIRSITFAAVTSTVKGTTATVTTESQIHHSSSQAIDSSSANQSHGNTEDEFPSAPQAIRKRSTSFDVAKDVEPPAAMQIIASINEDGLGLPSWWD
jgi:DNA-directed RNA polymerase III subunit RPC8